MHCCFAFDFFFQSFQLYIARLNFRNTNTRSLICCLLMLCAVILFLQFLSTSYCIKYLCLTRLRNIWFLFSFLVGSFDVFVRPSTWYLVDFIFFCCNSHVFQVDYLPFNSFFNWMPLTNRWVIIVIIIIIIIIIINNNNNNNNNNGDCNNNIFILFICLFIFFFFLVSFYLY